MLRRVNSDTVLIAVVGSASERKAHAVRSAIEMVIYNTIQYKLISLNSIQLYPLETAMCFLLYSYKTFSVEVFNCHGLFNDSCFSMSVVVVHVVNFLAYEY